MVYTFQVLIVSKVSTKLFGDDSTFQIIQHIKKIQPIQHIKASR